MMSREVFFRQGLVCEHHGLEFNAGSYKKPADVDKYVYLALVCKVGRSCCIPNHLKGFDGAGWEVQEFLDNKSCLARV